MTVLRRAAPFVLAAVFFGAAACTSADDAANPGSSSKAGSGGGAGAGTGGAGGAGGSSPSGPPSCDAPGGPSGPTPEARADTAGVLGLDGRTFVVFGGDVANVVCGGIPKRMHVGDTWLLDAGCGTWTQLDTAAKAPGARARHAMVLDVARGRALLFGGRTRAGDTGPYTLFNDVWAFDFASKSWSELVTTGTPPSPRSNAAAAVVGSELVVVGGNTSTDGLTLTPAPDTFALDLTTSAWRAVKPTGAAAPAMLFHAAASDDTTLYVYGGGNANAFVGPFFREVWALDVATPAWSKIDAKPPPDNVGRIKLGLAARPSTGGATTLLAFAGHDDGSLGNRNDVLELDRSAASPAWISATEGDVYQTPATGQCAFPPDFVKTDLASPERRSGFAFAPREDGAAFVVFGGDSDCGRLSDAWWFDAVLGKWTAIRKTLPGLTCPRTGNTMCAGLCG